MRRFIVPPHGCTYIDLRLLDARVPGRGRATAEDDTHGEGEGPDPGPPPEGSEPEERMDESDFLTDDGGRLIVLHALQVFRGTPYRANELHKYVTLHPGGEHVHSWPVHEEVTLELTLGRSWSCVGDTICSATVYFRGIISQPSSICITGGQRMSKIIRLFASLSPVEISPAGKLETWQSCIKPVVVGKVAPLGERDILLDGRPVYQLVLEYEVRKLYYL